MDHPNRSRMDEVFAGDLLAAGIGCEVVDWDAGRATVRWVPRPEQNNMLSGVHGGGIFTLADAAFGIAINAWGRISVALSMEVQFLVASPVGEPLVATAIERARTWRTAAYQIDVTTEASGTLVSMVQAMGFRTSRWHFGEDAWPAGWRERC
jgi:acyl-CoA thioesterase